MLGDYGDISWGFNGISYNSLDRLNYNESVRGIITKWASYSRLVNYCILSVGMVQIRHFLLSFPYQGPTIGGNFPMIFS